MKCKLDIKQQPFDSMRIECIIIFSLVQKPKVTTCSCLCRGFAPCSQPAEHCVSCWALSRGTGLTGTLAGGCCGSLHLVHHPFLPGLSEVWGQEREATVRLRLSPPQGGFQTGCPCDPGVQICLWAWMDTPACIRLLPSHTLYFVAPYFLLKSLLSKPIEDFRNCSHIKSPEFLNSHWLSKTKLWHICVTTLVFRKAILTHLCHVFCTSWFCYLLNLLTIYTILYYTILYYNFSCLYYPSSQWTCGRLFSGELGLDQNPCHIIKCLLSILPCYPYFNTN